MTEIILTSSVLILILITLRYSLQRRISLRLQYGLWGFAALRLIMPFSLFRSPLSIMNVVNKNAKINEAANYFLGGLNYTQVSAEPVATGMTNAAAPPIQAGGQSIAANSMPPSIDLPEMLMIVWLAGAMIVAAWLITSNLVLRQRLRTAEPCPEIKCALPVYHAEWLPSPCLFGMLHPAIYLNASAYGNKCALPHVLTHELCHHAHRDQLWSVVRGLCLVLHWYNPLVWAAAVLSKRDCELACDESAIAKLGEAERIPYGMTLLTLIQQSSASPQLASIATTMTSGKRSLKERVILISKKPKLLMIVAICLALVIALAVGCTFTAEEQSYAETLLAHKTAYIEDNSKIKNLLDALRFDDGWERDTFELKTDEHPYRLTINFNVNAEAMEALVYTQDEVENPEPNPQPSLASESALMLFALIEKVDEVYFRLGNVDEISFGLPGTMDNNLYIDFDREWADETAKEDIRNFADTPEHLEELLAIQGCLGIFVGANENNPSLYDLTSRRRFQKAENTRRFLEAAKAQLEKPYALLADPPNSFNSFSLISYCLEQTGSDIPDMSCEELSEYDDWMKIGSLKSVRPGDILFFTDAKGRVDHAGIYIGNDRMIHASSSDGVVTKVSVSSKYWQSSFALGRRAW